MQIYVPMGGTHTEHIVFMHLRTHTCVWEYVCVYVYNNNIKRDHEFGRDPARAYGRIKREEWKGEIM